MNKVFLIILSTFFCCFSLWASEASFIKYQTTQEDSAAKYRSGWDVLHYSLEVEPDISTEQLKGKVIITCRVNRIEKFMRIDLFHSLSITSASINGNTVAFNRMDGGFYYLDAQRLNRGEIYKIELMYDGTPRKAVLPPWDGGVQWTVDSLGRPWVQVACQGIGASTWWPCKDVQDDEPEEGADIWIKVPSPLAAVSNGRLIDVTDAGLSHKIWHWKVTQPINNYSITMDVGYYSSEHWVHKGEKGPLDCWVYLLDYHTNHFDTIANQIDAMLNCFESKVAPYPFYEDSYKLVETAFLGMEHQSNIAYGNKFLSGYLGSDRSKTGIGLKFDFIIVHESGHEWFGNSITASSELYNWIHEGFTTYMETIFVECQQGKKAAEQYVIGQRHIIRNDKPLVDLTHPDGNYTSDIYDKGSSMIHTLRMMMNDDAKFYSMLRAMNTKFYHAIVDSRQIEDFIAQYSGLDLKPYFQQYLYSTKIPMLKYKVKGKRMKYWFENVVPGFTIQVAYFDKNGAERRVSVSSKPSKIKLPAGFDHWDANYYINFTLAE